MTHSSTSKPGQTFVVRECLRDTCRLRLPMLEGEQRGHDCPRCGGPTVVATRGQLGPDTPVAWATPQACVLHVLVDNVRSTFNVGSILRISDGVGVAHVSLCGITPTPQNRKVAKTALGAEETVNWTYFANALDAANDLHSRGVSLWALENVRSSRSLVSTTLGGTSSGVALVVGNEVTGIDPQLLERCDQVLHIPMNGSKGSLNVAVALGIAAYWLRGTSHLSNGENALCA